mgnify:CR=1 FL=1
MLKKDTSPAIIEFENIYATFQTSTNALENINLKINTNEHWAILGANGSGKSTLIKLISNDIYPNTAYPFKKKLFGRENWNIFDLKKKLGIITNDLHNYFATRGSHLTACQVVLSGYYSSVGIPPRQNYSSAQLDNALNVMEFLGLLLLKDRKVYEMSTGELRRCIIGRALIHKPQAFILDEPTVGLDIKAQNSLKQTLQKLSKNASIILVTHHLEEIIPEITHVALLYRQTIFKQGKKKDMLSSKNLSKIFDIQIEVQHDNDRYFLKDISGHKQTP